MYKNTQYNCVNNISSNKSELMDVKERAKKFKEAWKTQDIVSFYLSTHEYRYAVLGWCSYLVRPNVAPFSELKHGDKFKICGETETDYYVCRVDDVAVFEDVSEAVNEHNYRMVYPDGTVMTLDRVRYLISMQVYNNRYRQHIKKYGNPPKVMVLKYSLYCDPKM